MRISDWSSDVCSSDLTLDKNSLTLDLGGGEPLAASKPQTSNYSDRPYEKRLTQSGRRFISVDVDATLLEILDQNHGKLRRGVFLDRLLSKASAGGKGDNLVYGSPTNQPLGFTQNSAPYPTRRSACEVRAEERGEGR